MTDRPRRACVVCFRVFTEPGEALCEACAAACGTPSTPVPDLSNRAHAHHLPPSWYTLAGYTLADLIQLDEPQHRPENK